MASQVQAPSREKYWNELNAHERVSRMRGIVKTQGSKIKELGQQIDKLMKHSHSNGEITIPLNADNGATIGLEFRRVSTPEEDEKVYF